MYLNFSNYFNEIRKVYTKISINNILHKTSIENIVFDKGGIKYTLPVFPSLLNSATTVNCFHVTGKDQAYRDIDGISSKLSRLIALQGSKRPISCATTIDKSLITHGISGSGIILYLRGDLLIGGFADLATVPDENGQRWIGADSFNYIPTKSDNNGNWLYSLVRLRIIEARKSITQKYLRYMSKIPLTKIGMGNPKKAEWILEPGWEYIPNFTSKEIIADIIKDYIQECRKVWVEAAKFIDYEKAIRNDHETSNEVLVNNIKINFVTITSNAATKSEFKHLIKNLGGQNNIKFYYIETSEVFNWLKEFTKTLK